MGDAAWGPGTPGSPEARSGADKEGGTVLGPQGQDRRYLWADSLLSEGGFRSQGTMLGFVS